MFPNADTGGEYFMFATQGQKISRYNIAQDRIIMLSSTSVYLLTETEARRSMPISHLKYIIRSNSSCEILLYFADDSDFRLVIPNQDHLNEFFQTINMRFPALCPNVRLKLFGVPEPSLKNYKAAKKGFVGQKFAFENEPAPEYRLRDQEIATETEYADEKSTATPSEQSAENFQFVHRGSAVKGKGKNMVQPVMAKADDGAMDFGDDMLLDEGLEMDNLDAHFNELLEAEKANDGAKRKRRLNDEEMKELRSTNLVSRRQTCEKVVKFEDFNFLMVIGRGAFGKVFLAQLKQEESSTP